MTNLLERIYDFANSEVTADVNNTSVETDALTDSQDGQAWETLKEAGYETGGFVPVESYFTGGNMSTTSTSYSDNYKLTWLPIADDWPSDVTIGARITGLANAGSGETLSVRLQNKDDNDTVVSFSTTESSFTSVSSGVQQYTPSNPPGPYELVPGIKTEPGSNSSAIDRVGFTVGVIL